MALTANKVYAILKRQISDMEAKIKTPIIYRGTVATADLLPLNPDIGDMYNIESKSIYGEAGMNVAWNGVVWDTMGAPIDMSLYIKSSELSDWVKQQNKPTYTAEEVGALPDTTVIPSKTSELQNDSGFLTKIPDNYLSGTDKTLNVSGKAADAKATGDKITELSADISKKLNKNQGSENSGKIAGINESGDIVPMFPVSVDYNEETNCLEFGSDQKMELNKGINLDSTLTKTGSAADAGAVGEITNSLKEDLSDVRIKYTNLFKINPNVQDVIISNGIGTIYASEDYIDVEKGKPYFIYVKFKITNLINWIQGYVYARLIYAVDASGFNTPLRAIRNNSEFSICYNFIAKKSGKVGVQLYFNNQLPSTNSYNCQCIKLFVAQTSDDIKELVELEEQTNSISKIKLKPETVTWDNLSNDVKEKIERAPTNYTIIDCWGDSLTQGAGATNYPYPTKLQELIGEQFVVNNYGQGSEIAEVIAFRQGGMGAIVLPFTAGTNASDYNKVTIRSINGASLETMSYSGKYYGNNIVYLNGTDKWMFRRRDGHLNLVCADGSLLGKEYSRPAIVFAEGEGIGHVAIICIGQNGWAAQTSRPEALADIIQKMVEHNGSERYIIVGRPTGNKNERNVEEIILASRFSNHFVNAREYISAYGLSDNGLSPTQEDTESMSSGAIPPQLRIDNVHMNDYGYIAMANCIFNRGVSLGYWH